MQFLFIAQLIISIAGPIVTLVLKMLGFGFVTYTGINFGLDQVKDYILANSGGMAPQIVGILGLAKVDICMNIMLSAVATRALLAGVDKATDRKRNQIWNKPGETSIWA